MSELDEARELLIRMRDDAAANEDFEGAAELDLEIRQRSLKDVEW